jgi:hypothetical protein
MKSSPLSRAPFAPLIVILVACTVSLSGCVLVPFLQAFKEAGATEEDRMALLEQDLRRFNSAVVWGNRAEAMSFVAADSRSKVQSTLKARDEDERIVDSKVDAVEWGEGAREATVSLKVKFYKVPVYVVNTRSEQQRWSFSHADGWKITERTVDEG